MLFRFLIDGKEYTARMHDTLLCQDPFVVQVLRDPVGSVAFFHEKPVDRPDHLGFILVDDQIPDSHVLLVGAAQVSQASFFVPASSIIDDMKQIVLLLASPR